jgi:hypothetical protein
LIWIKLRPARSPKVHAHDASIAAKGTGVASCSVLLSTTERCDMTANKPIAKEDLARRTERLRRIGITDIPDTLPKLKLRGKEVRISRSSHPKHYYEVEVKDVQHLKQLVGNPDRSLETNGKRNELPFKMHAHEVPDGKFDDMSKLSRAEQVAVERAAKNVVFGHSQALGLDAQRSTALHDWIMKYAKRIPVFAASDLDVADGTTVVFSDAAVFNFNVVTVHGSGSIRFENSAKVIATEMRAVP